MDVSLRPNFYQDGVDSIEVDALEKVVNKDRYCFSLCDGLNQQAFLKRCHSLKTLEINIDHPKFFSWAVERNLSAMEKLFKELRELTMYMLGEYGALDDAMTAFGRMAMTIRVRDANYRGGDAAHTSVHASVGNWNLPAEM
ncbi:hypothetical protein BG003_009051 [Podila horticola]|nr:hypothetical protein BG003_009051 [Podila horticola]